MLRLEKYIKMKVKGELKITYDFNFWLVLVLTICKILVLAFYIVAPKLRTRGGGHYGPFHATTSFQILFGIGLKNLCVIETGL